MHTETAICGVTLLINDNDNNRRRHHRPEAVLRFWRRERNCKDASVRDWNTGLTRIVSLLVLKCIKNRVFEFDNIL